MNGRLRGNQATSRALNRHYVLSLLLDRGPLSRAELSEISGLSAATITFVVAELIATAFLEECKPESGSQGRRPIPVRINRERRLFAGLAIGRDGIECGLTDLDGIQQDYRRYAAEIGDTREMASTAIAAIAEMLSSKGREADCFAGIGIAFESECQSADLDSLTKILAEHFGQAVRAEHAVDAFAMSHSLFGHGRHRHRFAVAWVDDRLESSLISGGELVARRRPGVRFGKVAAYSHADRQSSLEETSSFSAMTALWADQTGQPCDAGAFLTAVGRREQDALSVARGAAERIGRHLSDVISFVDPEIIIVGGQGASLGDDFVLPMRESAACHLGFPPPKIVADWQPGDSARCAASVAALSVFGRPRG